MDEGELRGKSAADLLMSAKWVLPGRKTEEYDAVSFQEGLNMNHERLLIWWLYMLNDVMYQYEVIAQSFILWGFHLHEIVADEVCPSACELKEVVCFFDALQADVDACHPAPSLGKGQQIAPLATSNLQYPCVGCKSDEGLQIADVEVARSSCQLLEILLSV